MRRIRTIFLLVVASIGMALLTTLAGCGEGGHRDDFRYDRDCRVGRYDSHDRHGYHDRYEHRDHGRDRR